MTHVPTMNTRMQCPCQAAGRSEDKETTDSVVLQAQRDGAFCGGLFQSAAVGAVDCET